MGDTYIFRGFGDTLATGCGVRWFEPLAAIFQLGFDRIAEVAVSIF
jgi:hypothetical protein